MQDSEIVELLFSRDEAAIKAIQEKYGAYLTVIAANILSDPEDSEESVNDTYLAAWNSIPPHKPQALPSYLVKLVRRIAIDRYRRRNRGKRAASQYSISLDELEDCLSHGESAEKALESKLLTEAIERFLYTLDQDARNLFIGRYYYLDPLKRVAEYCGVSESKAKSTLFRTRKALKEYLQKEGFTV